MCKKEVKCKQEKVEQLNGYRFLHTKEWYEDKLRDQSKAKLNWDKTIDEIWTTFPEEEDQQISSIIIEKGKLPYTYKNYIYRDKNWKYSVYNADEGHCGHYYCILYKGIHFKDQAYKIKSSQ